MMLVLADWLLTAERVAVHLPTATAIVADPHLGYAEARRRGGEAVPDETLDEQLAGLARVLHRQQTRRLVIAGDLLEDGRCRGALGAFLEWLNRHGFELAAIVPGNHDVGLEALSISNVKHPLYPQGFTLGKWQVVHGDGRIPEGKVVHGHEHPCIRWSPRVRAMRPYVRGGGNAPGTIDGPCYLVGERRLILPAFSTEAAGVNVLSSRRWRSYRCYVVAGDCVLDVGEVSRLRSRLSAISPMRRPSAESRKVY
jgi:metallophosphoesterase superfamily enzyme